MNTRGILFDLDGVIVDSEEWNRSAFNCALLDFNYATLSEEEYVLTLGLNSYNQLNKLFAHRGIKVPNLDAIIVKKRLHAKYNIVKHCRPINRVTEVLQFVKQKFKVGLVTSCSKDSCIMTLNKMKIANMFSSVVTGCDVIYQKPHPLPYLKACSLLGVSPKNILVVEDSDNGIESAIGAGCNIWKLDNFNELSIENLTKRLARIKYE